MKENKDKKQNTINLVIKMEISFSYKTSIENTKR